MRHEKIQFNLIQETIDYLKKLPDPKFDMATFAKWMPDKDWEDETTAPDERQEMEGFFDYCGTAGCLAGHLGAIHKLLYAEINDHTPALVWGISHTMSRRLTMSGEFYGRKIIDLVTKEDVIEALQKMVDTGEEHTGRLHTGRLFL